MYEKNLNLALLLDFYGDMLTDKQRDAMDYYYNEDMSLAEIADHIGDITRQGVRDSIKRGEKSMLDMEEKLGLAARFDALRQDAECIAELAEDISQLNFSRSYNAEINDKLMKIKEKARNIIK